MFSDSAAAWNAGHAPDRQPVLRRSRVGPSNRIIVNHARERAGRAVFEQEIIGAAALWIPQQNRRIGSHGARHWYIDLLRRRQRIDARVRPAEHMLVKYIEVNGALI